MRDTISQPFSIRRESHIVGPSVLLNRQTASLSRFGGNDQDRSGCSVPCLIEHRTRDPLPVSRPGWMFHIVQPATVQEYLLSFAIDSDDEEIGTPVRATIARFPAHRVGDPLSVGRN